MDKFDKMQTDLTEMRLKLEEYEVEGTSGSIEARNIKANILKQEKSMKKEKEKNCQNFKGSPTDS